MSCPGESSGLITTTAGAAVSNVKQGTLLGLTATAGTVTLYDGADTSGRLIGKVVSTTDTNVLHMSGEGISFMNGLFIVVSAGEAVVYFVRAQ